MLKKSKLIFIPDNYSDVLEELKNKHFSWEMNFCSRTENKTIGHVTHYSIDTTPAENCVILIPGLASNTRNEPLMKVIEYWALLNKHDVYCLDTFLGDFMPAVSQELAEKHSFSEFVDLVDTGMDVIEKDVKFKKYQHSCLIGHSAGATAAFEIYNKRIRERKKLRFSASVMFAPFVERSFHIFIQNFFKKFVFNNKIDDETFKKTAIGLKSPHETQVDGRYTKISILPKFYDDEDLVEFRPELMDRYGIPITLVAGGLDKKSPPEELRKKYNVLREGKNGFLWKMVVFKDSRHSFIDQHKDYDAILKLIQSQKRMVTNRTR